MLKLSIDTRSLDKMARDLAKYKGTTRKHLSGATNLAAMDAKEHLVSVTPRYINKPTRWTLNSTFLKQSNQKNLEVTLGFKDYAVKGTPAADYLQPMIKGGARHRKGGENLIRGIAGARYMVPTGVTPVKFNQYGNISSGMYQKIYSDLRVQRDSGSTSNRRTRRRTEYNRDSKGRFSPGITKDKTRFFVGNPDDRGFGIYARVGRNKSGFHTIFTLHTRAPQYQARFPVSDILQKEFDRKFPSIFSRLVYKAHKT